MQCRDEEIFQRLSARAQDIVKDGRDQICIAGAVGVKKMEEPGVISWFPVETCKNIVGVMISLR